MEDTLHDTGNTSSPVQEYPACGCCPADCQGDRETCLSECERMRQWRLSRPGWELAPVWQQRTPRRPDGRRKGVGGRKAHLLDIWKDRAEDEGYDSVQEWFGALVAQFRTDEKVARFLRVSPSTVSRKREEMQIHKPTPAHRDRINDSAMAAEYRSGSAMETIAAKYGTKRYWVRVALESQGVVISGKGRKRA